MSEKKIKSSSEKELDKVQEQFDAFDANVKELTQDRMNEAPKKEVEPQTKLSQSEIEKSKDIYLKPWKTIGCKEKFNERFRDEYNFSKEYVHFIAENHEIIGEDIDLWTKPYPGIPAEEWKIPTNKAVWAPRYVAERVKGCVYHRLKMDRTKTAGADGMGEDIGWFYGCRYKCTKIGCYTSKFKKISLHGCRSLLMNFLSDVLTYIRRIIKSPSNALITDQLLIDYVNRFWIMDVDARLQLFDLKRKYQFQTTPGVDKYNMPLYNIQSETPGNPSSQDIGMYPVYQGFLSPAYINGIQVPLYTQENGFYNIWPDVTQAFPVISTGNGTTGPYTLTIPILPNSASPTNPPIQGILRGHVDTAGIIATGVNQDPPFGTTINTLIPTTKYIYSAVWFTSIDANGNNVIVQDSGQFLSSSGNQAYYGLLMSPGSAPYGNTALSGGYSTTSNTINYITGVANITFPTVIPQGQNINAQCIYIEEQDFRGQFYFIITL